MGFIIMSFGLNLIQTKLLISTQLKSHLLINKFELN